MNGNASSPGRVAALDLTKGVLVLCMVIYHALNYTTEYYLAFRYFAFLPPSFIIITGFLLASVYPARHSLSDWRLHRRLVVRGAKLLLLFTALNVLIQVTLKRNVFGATPGLTIWWTYWFETYISGEGRTASFEVLLPIACLLLLAPLLLLLDRAHRMLLPIFTVFTLGLLAWLAHRGGDWFNAQLMSAGLVGLLLGRISFDTLGRFARVWFLFALAYGVYFVLGRIHGQDYLLQLAGGVIALGLIYSLSARIDLLTFWGQRLERLGRYSLIGYIGQIGILQVLIRLIERPEPFSPEFFLLLLGTLLLTAFGVELVDWARSRSLAVGGVYKAVFA